MAAGRPKPIAAKPLEMSTVLGSRASQKRATQSLWAPTSRHEDVVGRHELAQVAQHALRLDRRVVVVAHVERHFEGAVVGRHLDVRQGAVAQQVAELFDDVR